MSHMHTVITSPEGTHKELYMLLWFTFVQYRLRPHIHVVQFDREFQTTLDQIGWLAQVELLMLMIKQQKKNLHVHVTANNEAIQAQQQLLQDLYPGQQSYQETLLPTEPDPGPGYRKLPIHVRKFSKLVILFPCKLNYLSYRKCFVKSVKQSM